MLVSLSGNSRIARWVPASVASFEQPGRRRSVAKAVGTILLRNVSGANAKDAQGLLPPCRPRGSNAEKEEAGYPVSGVDYPICTTFLFFWHFMICHDNQKT
jgi:hypothetical protein